MSYEQAVAQLDEAGRAKLEAMQQVVSQLHTKELRLCAELNRNKRMSAKKREAVEAERRAFRAEREANLLDIRALLYPVVEA